MLNNGVKENLSNCQNITYSHKINCLTRKQDRCPNSGLIEFDDFCRYLTRREIELAQTLPPGYTDNLSYLQMQDVCGDGWTVDEKGYVTCYVLDFAFEHWNHSESMEGIYNMFIKNHRDGIGLNSEIRMMEVS